ncbi:hypothetical protein REPUB_Repub19eG0058500 [Reevesia pubescens]
MFFVKRHRYEGHIPPEQLLAIAFLPLLKHDNIVRLQELSLDQFANFYFVYEYLDLHLHECVAAISKDKKLLKSVVYKILLGTQFYHAFGIAHQQLRPENILIDLHKGQVKIADFKLVGLTGLPKEMKATVSCYSAPEDLIRSTEPGIAVDIWSIGCIFGELVTGKPLFAGRNAHERLYSIYSILGQTIKIGDAEEIVDKFKAKDLHSTFDLSTLEPSGFDLLSKMLMVDPGKRITVQNALAHEYFDEVRNDN